MIFIYSALYTFSECCTNMIYNALEQERSHYFLAWGFCSLIPYLCDALRLACPAAQRELTAVVAEILMYVLIVVLQLWLILVLIYCYKKISAEQEAREDRKALKAQTKYALA